MIDVNSPDRVELRQFAADAKSQLTAALALMETNGFERIRVDQLQGPDGTIVETGYVYGESRLTVLSRDGEPVHEFRLNGRSPHRFNQFKELVGI